MIKGLPNAKVNVEVDEETEKKKTNGGKTNK